MKFRLKAVFSLLATIGNLHHTNVWKCPVLSGPSVATPVFTINPLYQQDLQQFPSCSRPDIEDIRLAEGLLRVFVTSWLIWLHLRLSRQFSVLFAPMSGNVRFCPVFSTRSRLSPPTHCKKRTYSSFPHASDRTYQTFAPQREFYASPFGNRQSAICSGGALPSD